MNSRAGPAPPASILFEHPETTGVQFQAAPGYFDDLNLDQVAAAILEGHARFGLEGLLWTPLHTPDEVKLRQEVFWQLDATALFTDLRAFTDAMGAARGHLAR